MPGKPTGIFPGDRAVMLVIDIEWVVHCICMQTPCLHSSQRQFIKQFYKGQQMSIDKPYHIYIDISIFSLSLSLSLSLSRREYSSTTRLKFASIQTYQFDLITLSTQGWH